MDAGLSYVISRGAHVSCDGSAQISALAGHAGVKLHVLPVHSSPMPDKPQFHIDHEDAYCSRMRKWLRRVYGPATDDLPKYLC